MDDDDDSDVYLPDAKRDDEEEEEDIASLLEEEISSPSAASSQGTSYESVVRKPAKSKLSKFSASTPATSSPPSTTHSTPKPALGAFGKPLDKGERAKNFTEKNKDRYSWLTDIRDKEGNRPGDENYDPRTLYIPNSAWKTFTAFERQYWYSPQFVINVNTVGKSNRIYGIRYYSFRKESFSNYMRTMQLSVINNLILK